MRQCVIAIHDSLVIYNCRQLLLQFTTGISIHDIIRIHERTSSTELL